MDISKLHNANNQVNKTGEAPKDRKSSGAKKSGDTSTDKVSINDYKFRNNDQLFAKIELQKLNDSLADRLPEINKQLKQFNNASGTSEQTALEKKVNDPSVWESIAYKILK